MSNDRHPQKRFRRELRRRSTYSERILWIALQNRRLDGAKFRRQYTIGPYTVDYYCAERLLVIEVDGASHSPEDVKKYDVQRQAFIESMGFTVLRFNDEDVANYLDHVLVTIQGWLLDHRTSD